MNGTPDLRVIALCEDRGAGPGAWSRYRSSYKYVDDTAVLVAFALPGRAGHRTRVRARVGLCGPCAWDPVRVGTDAAQVMDLREGPA